MRAENMPKQLEHFVFLTPDNKLSSDILVCVFWNVIVSNVRRSKRLYNNKRSKFASLPIKTVVIH